MKKMALLVLLAGAACGILFAQTAEPLTTISGTLGLNNGRIALKSETTTYYVRGLNRYIGFIDGLKDGAHVSLEGYASEPSQEGQTERLFLPVKLVINEKVYEIGSAMAGNGGSEHSLEGGRPGRGVSRRHGW